jgi:hypothetical protein
MTVRVGGVPVLYHGTTRAAARRIESGGFRPSRSGHYLGRGVCLSESMSVAYEYGAYEDGGVVLEVRLGPATRWDDAALLAGCHVDAVRAFGGNVWHVAPQCTLALVRRLSKTEAHALLADEFTADGPDVAYNGVVQDLAEAHWPGSPGRVTGERTAADESNGA